MITYATDTTPEFAIGTVATHSCSAGFSLVGAVTRTCMDDDQADIVGVWTDSDPSCERKFVSFLDLMSISCFYSTVSLVKRMIIIITIQPFCVQQSSVHP